MKKWLILGLLALAIVTTIWAQGIRISELKGERDRYRENTDVLLSEVESYKVRDSLNVVRTGVLELRLSEFERYRAEDAALIKELRGKNRDLSSLVTAQTRTINELRAIPKDTVIIVDSIPVQAKSVEIHNEWFDFRGVLTDTEFTGELENREALMIANTITYKRFLGFLWKTKRVDDIQVDVVSKNPHTTIISVDAIEIKK